MVTFTNSLVYLISLTVKVLFEKLVVLTDSIRINMLSKSFINIISRQNYAHNLDWCGAQIYQTPTDLFLYQQLIFRSRPNVIVETGVAKGGSILFACQMLDLLNRGFAESNWKVICCDINSLDDAKTVIAKHGYSERVIFFNGDSSGSGFLSQVQESLKSLNEPRVLVSLDSNHTEEHVYRELMSLAGLVSKGSYAIVWDSRIGDLSRITHFLRQRAWSKGRHAGTGAVKYMKSIGVKNGFVYDSTLENALKITGVKRGVLFKP